MASGGQTSKKASASILRDASSSAGGDSTDPEAQTPVDNPPASDVPPASIPRGAAPPKSDTDPGAAPAPRSDAEPRAHAEPARFKLVITRGPKSGTEVLLDRDIVTIGRGADNTLTIADVSVSRHHVRFQKEGTGFAVTDLDSGNGTRVNGTKVTTARLRNGDEVIMGDSALQFVELGAPAVAPVPAPPTTATGAPNVPTQGIVAHPTSRHPSIGAKVPPSAKGKSSRRMRLYMALFALLIVFFAGAWLVKNGADIGGLIKLDTPSGGDPALSVLEKARTRIKERKWGDAYQILQEGVIANPESTRLRQWAESAKIDADAQKLYDDARTALGRGDYASAMSLAGKVSSEADFGADAAALLSSMPEVFTNAVNDARAAFHGGDRARAQDILTRVLSANPTNEDARALQEELNRPVAEKPVERKGPVVKAPVPERPTGPNFKCFGPAMTAYLTNDLKSALRLAAGSSGPGCPGLSQQIGDFSQHFSKGQSMEAAKHYQGASIEFTLAVKIDAAIVEGRPSQPGRAAKAELAKLDYDLALDCKGDELLARRAQHLRSAIQGDPSNDAAKKDLDKTYARARELYMEGYVNRDPDPDTAKRQFTIVVQTLPPGDETVGKAQHWLEQMREQKQ